MSMFRRISCAAAGALFLAATASTASADGMRRGSVKDAESPFSWSGLYVGVHAGWGWSDADITLLNGSFYGVAGARSNTSIDGPLAGGHLGVQHQWGRWVAGVEVSMSGADISGTAQSPGFPGIDFWDVRLETLVTATGRLGYVWAPRTLTYIKGGYAGGDVSVKFKTPGSPTNNREDNEWHNGWTVGAGIEHALKPGVIVGLEYNYIDLGDATHNAFSSGGALTSAKVDLDPVHTVSARLTFKTN